MQQGDGHFPNTTVRGRAVISIGSNGGTDAAQGTSTTGVSVGLFPARVTFALLTLWSLGFKMGLKVCPDITQQHSNDHNRSPQPRNDHHLPYNRVLGPPRLERANPLPAERNASVKVKERKDPQTLAVLHG